MSGARNIPPSNFNSLQVEENLYHLFDPNHRASRDFAPTADEALLVDCSKVFRLNEADLTDSPFWRGDLNVGANALAARGDRDDAYQACGAMIENVGREDEARPRSRLLMT